MAESIDILALQRENIRRLNNAIRNYNKDGAARKTASYYATRLESVNSIFHKITSVHMQLIQIADDDASEYSKEDTFEKAEEAFINYKAELLEGLSALQPPAPQQQPPPGPPPPNGLNEIVNDNYRDFRLPTIAVPTFNGEYHSWPSYKNSFQHLVADNLTLSNLQRLHYLKGSLTGDAKRLIQHYDLVEANYAAAWQKLMSRYDNKKLLVNNNLKSLIHHPGQTKETASQLRLLIDTFSDCLNGLRTLDVSTEGWDPIIVHLLIEKLSVETHSLWEASQMANNDLPTYANLIIFLENRFRTLEAIAEKPSQDLRNPFDKPSKYVPNGHNKSLSHVASTTSTCSLCHDAHYLRSCSAFLRMAVIDRIKYVQQQKACVNCLAPGHHVRTCRSRMNCSTCNKRHHSLLHVEQVSPESSNNFATTTTDTTRESDPSDTSEEAHSYIAAVPHTGFTSLAGPTNNSVLLATACINVMDYAGDFIQLRAFIDPGSQVSFITTKAIQRLRLKAVSTNAKVFGIGNTFSGTSTKRVTLSIQSNMDSTFKLESEFLTIPQITGSLPQVSYMDSKWSHIRNLQLADPNYNKNSPVDILLGAEVYGLIVLPGLRKGQIHEPIAQNTAIGWILLGGSSSQEATTNLSLHTCIDIDSRLRSFWEYEEPQTPTKPFEPENLLSEAHFIDTYSRTDSGRYTVRLPFKAATSTLGSSRESAISRLLQIERKFTKNPQLAKDYSAFMDEYETLGHMKPVLESSSAYYIPHHPVFKHTSTTTKLRVVFDASRKTNTGVSLNDILRVGPTIQDDLSSLLTRWRKFPIAFTADLEKMYRQIRIANEDLDFQRIVWRSSPHKRIQDYQLQTVTYGTACAQFLAIRTLHQLANDGSATHPLAAKIMLEDFYVDDLMSGAYKIDDAIEIQQQLRDLSQTGGFNLRKWACNHDALLQSIPTNDREIKTSLLIDFDDTIKSLGIHWNPRSDEFTYQSTLDSSFIADTKRSMLSDISKLFDPLGWLSPLIVRAKILMQKLWCLDLNWDDKVPGEVFNQWRIIREDLQRVHLIKFPRSMAYSLDQPIELHGFSDASIHAFSAVVYSRILQPDGRYVISLLSAKTKVSPIKTISLPRLELCGAHLLSKLINRIRTDLRISDVQCHAWCDSSIVLHWMRGHPNRLKTFVANRVSDIMERGNIAKWHHVSGKDNPADCATRGLDAEALSMHPLWWNGPSWLSKKSESWPTSIPDIPADLPEVKSITLTAAIEENIVETFINAHSSLTHLTRVMAFIKRFLHNSHPGISRYNGPLTTLELKTSLNCLICHVQKVAFPLDYQRLESDRELHPRSSILTLNPFLDEDRLLRVGGRLHNSTLSFTAKHPIILPKEHHFTRILIRQVHLNTLHGGPELVITTLRHTYWVINMRSVVRQITHQCIRCFRFNAKPCTQQMGNLPSPRVQIDRVFTHTGIDCAGPIDLRMSKGRGSKSYKGYIVLFICLSTKAIHIEAVSDMATSGFLAAYRRFCARRGMPRHLYSDNGTNFVGASRTLRKESTHFINVSADLLDDISKQGSEWHFIPPASPHFGGLWEAGIKSIKHHLKRVVGDSTLTFEELSTVLYQIEACLNSRPLCPTTSDPTDDSVLTPGHFLIGNALLAPPESLAQTICVNSLTRWQLVQKMRNDFWRRWQREYLTRMQQRPKWVSKSSNLEKDDLVLLMEDNLPPTRWALGRILETHPGRDGLVRVATLRCQGSIIKRPIAKLSLLPLSHNPATAP